MNDAVATTVATTGSNVVAQAREERRPRPVVRQVTDADLDWDPVASPLFTLVNGESVRAGDAFAIIALCHLLGRDRYGAALDEALGGRRYSDGLRLQVAA